jgi:sugar-specific transcriptional regulator TrmB
MVMAMDAGAVRTYFAKLGLEAEIADIYLALHTYGPQSISQLSRNAHIERTRIYRLIDQLMDSNLIEVESQQKRGIIKAAPIANLHILITQKEQDLKSLQDELGLIEQVLARNSLSSPVSRVQFYEGPEASKQIRQRMLSAKTEVLSILFKDIYDEIEQQFAGQWIAAVNRQNTVFRNVATRRPGAPVKGSSALVYPKSWAMRYIATDIFPVTYSTFIYDNVVATYQWHNKTIYGMEIYNEAFANTHKTVFEMLWQQSQDENV